MLAPQAPFPHCCWAPPPGLPASVWLSTAGLPLLSSHSCSCSCLPSTLAHAMASTGPSPGNEEAPSAQDSPLSQALSALGTAVPFDPFSLEMCSMLCLMLPVWAEVNMPEHTCWYIGASPHFHRPALPAPELVSASKLGAVAVCAGGPRSQARMQPPCSWPLQLPCHRWWLFSWLR